MVAENAQIKQQMAENQDVAAKYHHVIDTTIFMTQETEETETDNRTIQTQW